MAHNRLLGFHVVRSTRPVQFTPTSFVPDKDHRTLRDDSHRFNNPDFPDPEYHLDATQQYFFRHVALRHLRVEQFNRYFWCGEINDEANPTIEDTCEDEDDALPVERHHKHFDEFAEEVLPGSGFQSTTKHVPGARKRKQARLGVSRTPILEPIGEIREKFYEQKLLLGLAWYCAEKPTLDPDGKAIWTFNWDPPEDIGDVHLEGKQLVVSSSRALSFEHTCAELENEFSRHGLVCACCVEEMGSVCKSCRFAIGFHRCENANNNQHLVWRKGTLHGGDLDIQRVIYNLHRKGLPTKTLREKSEEYVKAKLLDEEMADKIIRVIEGERDCGRAEYCIIA